METKTKEVKLEWLRSRMFVGTDHLGKSVAIGYLMDDEPKASGVNPSDMLLLAAASCSALGRRPPRPHPPPSTGGTASTSSSKARFKALPPSREPVYFPSRTTTRSWLGITVVLWPPAPRIP